MMARAAELAVRAVVRHGAAFALDVDLRLPARGVTAILGPSGSGKTTLLRAVAGLVRPAPGRVALGDAVWQDETEHGPRIWLPAHRRPIGFVFQEASLFEHLSVAGNLDFGRRRVPPGKLLRAVAGLVRPAPGRVALGDAVWQDDTERGRGLGSSIWPPAHRRPTGFVFQEASLFEHLSVAGNLDFGRRRVPPGEQRVALDQAIELLGIGALLDRRPARLSGGERQRVAIARALAASPALLLMDEPLAALDAARKAELLPYFERLARDGAMPILYVTHAVDEAARLSQRLLLLRQGRCVALGDTAQVLARLNVAQNQGDNAGAILDGEVQATDAAYGLMTVQFGPEQAGRIQCLQTAPPRAPGAPVRLRVLARDVSVTLTPARDSSILNIVPAVVQELADDGAAQVLLRLDACGAPLLARITRKSATALALAPGAPVYAQIKGVAVVD